MTVSKALIKSISSRTHKHIHLWINLSIRSRLAHEYPNVSHLLALIPIPASVDEEILRTVGVLLHGHQRLDERRDQLIEIYTNRGQKMISELYTRIPTKMDAIGTTTIEKLECEGNKDASKMFDQLISFGLSESPVTTVFDNGSKLRFLKFDIEALLERISEILSLKLLVEKIDHEANSYIETGIKIKKQVSVNVSRDFHRLLWANPRRVWKSVELKKAFGDIYERPNNLPWDHSFNKRIDQIIHRLAKANPDLIIIDQRKRRSKPTENESSKDA